MEFPKRKLTRLKGYDYSQSGYYFITMCTHNKRQILCDIAEGDFCTLSEVVLSKIGMVAERELLKIEAHYDNVKIDRYVIMPNHIHVMFRITERINPFPTARCDISNIIGKYKAAVTRFVGNAFMHSEKLWQTSFHDHIVRDEKDYVRICEYIDTNPQKWKDDCFYIKEA